MNHGTKILPALNGALKKSYRKCGSLLLAGRCGRQPRPQLPAESTLRQTKAWTRPD
jgi:hypothetical protein